MPIEMRVINIPNYKLDGIEVFQPSPTDWDSGINNDLNHAGSFVINAGNHSLFEMPSPSPHHPYPIPLPSIDEIKKIHKTYWVNRGTGETVNTDIDTPEDIAVDKKFLDGVEKKFTDMHTSTYDKKVYMMIGFVLPGTEDPRSDLVITRGVQTQRRLHIHESAALKSTIPFNSWANLKNPKEYDRAKISLNLAGEAAIKDFPAELEGFGERFTYLQEIGPNGYILPRTMFGFDTLYEAISSAVRLQNEVKVNNKWIKYAYGLAMYSKSFSTASYDTTIKQSQIPNMAIIIPTDFDRTNGQVTSKKKIWVMPFTVCPPQEVLTPRGALILR